MAHGSSRHPRHRHFDDHRLALTIAGVTVSVLVLMLLGVGIQPTGAAPATDLPIIGRWDEAVYSWVRTIRTDGLTDLFRLLDLSGKGVVTIPLRVALLAVLLSRRRWGAAIAFAIAWAASESALHLLKALYARGRPPEPLVETTGYSFPSGHATAGAAIGISIVLAFLAPGPRRRLWELLAAVFAFAMALSRVYLGAHWLSDVVAGVLLGASVALVSFGVVDELWHVRSKGSDPSGPQRSSAEADASASSSAIEPGGGDSRHQLRFRRQIT